MEVCMLPEIEAPSELAQAVVISALGNSLEAYLRALAIFAGWIVVSKLVKVLVLARLKVVAKRTKGDLDDFLIETISKVNWWFFAAVGAYISAQSLELPDMASRTVKYFFVIVMTIQVVKILGEGITYALAKTAAKEKNGKNLVLHAFGRIINVLLWVLAGIFVLSNFGVNVTSLIAGLGITTMAIALAAQPMLKDFFGAITIIGGGLFKNGDLIMFDGSLGTVESIGMRISTATDVTEIIGSERVQAVRLRSGNLIPCELLLLAIGIRPNTALAKAAGLLTDHGIVIDRQMRTSDPNIYAIGECAELEGNCYGLLSPLHGMAKIAARHLAGDHLSEYGKAIISSRLKISGIDLYVAGNSTGRDSQRRLVFENRASGIYKQIAIKNDRIDGFILMGDIEDGPWFFKQMEEEADVSADIENLIFGKGYFNNYPLDPNGGLCGLAS